MLHSVQSDHPVHGHTLPVVSPLVNGLIHDALLQSSPRLNKPLLKNDLFWHFSGTVATVCGRGGQTCNLLMSSSFRIQCAKKWLKSVHFWRSYSENKNVSVFWGHTIFTCAYSRLWRRWWQRLGPQSTQRWRLLFPMVGTGHHLMHQDNRYTERQVYLYSAYKVNRVTDCFSHKVD